MKIRRIKIMITNDDFNGSIFITLLYELSTEIYFTKRYIGTKFW